MGIAITAGLSARSSSRIGSAKRYQVIETIYDLLAVVVAWQITIVVRPFLNPFMSMQLERNQLLELAPPLTSLLFLAFLGQLWIRVHRPGGGLYRTCESIGISESWVIASAVAITDLVFSQFGNSLSRSVVFLFIGIYLFTLLPRRLVVRSAVSACEARWPARERIAMLGRSRIAIRFFERLRNVENDGMQVVGLIVPKGRYSYTLPDGVPIVGTTNELAAVINKERLDRILIVDNSLKRVEMRRCVEISKRMGIVMSHAIDYADPSVRLELSSISGTRLLEAKPVLLNRKYEAIKRAFDTVASAIMLIALAPVIGFIAVLIKATSPGPVLYKASRVGRGGRHFTFLKFRSMYKGSENRAELSHQNEKSGHIFKLRDDPRVTPIGRILRRYSLDELPQLVNVLRGDMSLVGPRPLPAQDLDPDGQSGAFRFWAEQRSTVLPGITGMWQVHGRSDLDFADMVRLDSKYVGEWSLFLDFSILLETPLVVLAGRGAY